LISRLKIIFAVIIYVSCDLSMKSCGVLRFSGTPATDVCQTAVYFIHLTNTISFIRSRLSAIKWRLVHTYFINNRVY